MAQLLANNASALLVGAITAIDTTLSVDPARADLFPIGTTTNFVAPLDWFKATLEDVSGNTEIIKVGVRTSGSGAMTTLVRGQDGTTARAFAAGSVVELRITAADIQAAIAAASATASSIANFPAGNIAATNVQAAINELDTKKVGTLAVQAQTFTAFTTTGISVAYVLATSPIQTALAANQRYRVKLHTPNGLNPTLARDGLAAAPFKVYNSAGAKVTPAAGTLPTLFDVEYDGTDYLVLDPLPSAVNETAVQSQTFTAFTTAGTATAYTLTPVPAIGALAANQRFRVKFHLASGAAPTLAVSGLAATAFKVYDATGAKVAPALGLFATGMLVDVEYDGVDYVAPSKDVVSGTLLAVTTFTASATFTKLAGTNKLFVEGVGGGGGGGGVIFSTLGYGTGAGGGSGQYRSIYISAPAASYSFTIGTAGALVNQAVGGTGGASTGFGLSCSGGIGGSGPVLGSNGNGGFGGSGGSGGINVDGRAGAPGVGESELGFSVGGRGADSMFGGGGRPGVKSGQCQNGNLGGGGGGSADATSLGGGTGGTGVFRVWEYA